MPIFLTTSQIDDTVAVSVNLQGDEVCCPVKGTINVVDINVGPYPQPPTTAIAYCTVEDVMTYLASVGFKNTPQMLLNIERLHIPVGKRRVDRYTHTNWEYTRVQKFYDGSATDTQPLKFWPVNEVFDCQLRVIPSIQWYRFMRIRHMNQTDDDGRVISTAYPYATDADLLVDCRTGLLVIPPRILYLEMQAVPFWNYTWLPATANVQVDFAYGYKPGNFPADIVAANALYAAADAIMTASIEKSQGAVSVSIGDASRSYGAKYPYAGIVERWEANAATLLNSRRRIYV